MDRAAGRARISPRSLWRAGKEAQEWGHPTGSWWRNPPTCQQLQQLGCSAVPSAEEGWGGGILLPLPPPVTVTVAQETRSKASQSWQPQAGSSQPPGFWETLASLRGHCRGKSSSDLNNVELSDPAKSLYLFIFSSTNELLLGHFPCEVLVPVAKHSFGGGSCQTPPACTVSSKHQ